MNTPSSPTRATVLAFDVFGTVVDWHTSIAREVQALCPNVNGGEFALAWRAGYQPAMRRVMSGELVSCPTNKGDMKSSIQPPCGVARRCHSYGYVASSRLA